MANIVLISPSIENDALADIIDNLGHNLVIYETTQAFWEAQQKIPSSEYGKSASLIDAVVIRATIEDLYVPWLRNDEVIGDRFVNTPTILVSFGNKGLCYLIDTTAGARPKSVEGISNMLKNLRIAPVRETRGWVQPCPAPIS